MRILMIGDVVGRTGRAAVTAHMPGLIERLQVDFTVVNGENAAHGFGITQKIADDFYALGADAITTGNHVWDQRELMNTIDNDPKILRPLNYPDGTPGRGGAVFETKDGRRVLIVHAMCRLFMDPLDDPFAGIEKVLLNQRLDAAGNGAGGSVGAILVDFHGEATSEKMALGHHLDGRVTAVVGTHTHVPTADAQVLPGGTAYQSDLGMTGDYDSVIGMRKENAVARFTTKLPQGRLEPADGEATLCGALIETDDASGLAAAIKPVRIGGRLAEQIPE